MVPPLESARGSAIESIEFAVSAMLFGAGMGAMNGIVYFAFGQECNHEVLAQLLAASISGSATGLAYSMLRAAARRISMRTLDARNEPTTRVLLLAIAEAVLVGTIWGSLSAVAGVIGTIAYFIVVSGTLRVPEHPWFLFAFIAVVLSWPVSLGTFLLLRQSIAIKTVSSILPPGIGVMVGFFSVPVANYLVGYGALFYFFYLA